MLSQLVKRMIDSVDSFLQDKEGVMNRMPTPAWMNSNPRQDIKPESVTYSRLHPTARPYTAVVSPPGGESAASKKYNLQQAINFCHAKGFGRIFVRNGTYTIGTNITMYDNIELVGESRANTIFDFNNGTNYINATGTLKNVSVSNLTIQNYGGGTAPIVLDQNQGCTIDMCTFLSNASFDIWSGLSADCQDLRITNNFCGTSGGFLMGSYTGRNALIGWNYIAKPGSTAIKGIAGADVTGNYFLNCNFSAVTGVISFSKISNNYFLNCGSGANGILQISASGNFIIEANIFDQEGNSSPSTINLGSSCDDFTIANNYMNPRGYGIYMNYSVNGAILGNVINGGTPAGIFLTGTQHVVISGNRIKAQSTGTTYAVNISDSACGSTVVVANALTANTANVNDAGTGGTVTANA